MLSKRKQATPPESPAPSKRPTTRSRSPIPVGANGQPLEVIPGKGEQVSKLPNVTKQKIGQPHATVANAVQAEHGVNNPEREPSEAPRPAEPQLENISHGQLVARDAGGDPDAPAAATAPPKPPTAEQCKQLKLQAHIVPTHAGWFTWTSVHPIERRALPEFFDGKNKVKTPELYMEYRNFVVHKYRENPEKILAATDIQDMVADPNAVRRIIEFLDHWGLINYHAPVRPGQCHPAWQGVPPKIEENSAGELQAIPHSGAPLASLYQFDSLHTPSRTSASTSSDPVTALAESVVSETASPPGPSVEYHCNACSADCSKRRYHCQKQADFDLCPDCYNDGKFGPGMSTADFIRLDALSDSNSDGGGWSDQETLLLLEGLELYGDNWNEIAEHVATKSKSQCILHFVKMPIEDPFLEDVEASASLTSAAVTHSGKQVENEAGTPKKVSKLPEQKLEAPSKSGTEDDSVLKAIMDASSGEGLSGPDGLIAFSDAGNPVMAQVAFLAAMVGPRVAAAAAQSALMALSEEDPASQVAAKATFVLEGPSTVPLPPSLDRLDGTRKDDENEGRKDVNLMEDGHGAVDNTAKEDSKAELQPSKPEAAPPRGKPPSAEKIRNAAATALAAAAVKAKLLADQEEREMQRLVASVIENQLKKLETKLKQFGELEVMLKKEYEQIERARQRHFAERARLLASRIAPATQPPPGQGAPTTTMEAAQATSSSAAAAVANMVPGTAQVPGAGANMVQGGAGTMVPGGASSMGPGGTMVSPQAMVTGGAPPGTMLSPAAFNKPMMASQLGMLATGAAGMSGVVPQQMQQMQQIQQMQQLQQMQQQMRPPQAANLFTFGGSAMRPSPLGPFPSGPPVTNG